MELFELGMLFLGHTHIPFVDRMTSESDNVYLMCNPGSVGQPRDNDPRASYAVVDLANISAEIRRVEYDIDEVRKRISDVGLPDHLGKRLQKGR
jgi:diadenosine tetraphosphatase ApaH/serine/threonine PP2A family protein phosphatase